MEPRAYIALQVRLLKHLPANWNSALVVAFGMKKCAWL
jgi:hypothetical protein